MFKFILVFIIGLIVLILPANKSEAFNTPWSVTTLDNPAPGYLVYDWQEVAHFFLLDNYGKVQYADTSKAISGNGYYKPLSNGNWICYNWFKNKYLIYNSELLLIDSIPLSANKSIDFHDVEMLSNGHVIVIYMDTVIVDMSQIVDGGNTEAHLMGAYLVETDRTGTVYWTWSAFDHFSYTDVTDNIDLTQYLIDFTHVNSVTVDLDGNILLSSRHLDEITKIDKATGNIIWRMGGSECKNNQFTFTNDEINGFVGFSHQHSLSVLPNGNFLLFDNGNLKPIQYSRAVEYSVNQNNRTVTKVWEYDYNYSRFALAMGSAQRLLNGNTLIDWGFEKITEVRPNKSVAFELTISSVMEIYRAYKVISKMKAVSQNINSTGNYNFSQQGNETGFRISVSSLNGNSLASVEKHSYKPLSASYSDNNFTQIINNRWVFCGHGINNIAGTVYININGLNIEDPTKVKIFKRDKENLGVFQPLQTSFNSSTNEVSANFSGLGEFVICSYKITVPVLLSPVNDKLGVEVDGIMKWNRNSVASGYFLQISKDITFSQKIIDTNVVNDTIFNYRNLENYTDYYWRLKAYNSNDTSNWTNIFNFTTILDEPELLYPANNKIGLRNKELLSWDTVPGATNYWLQVSEREDFTSYFIDNINITGTNIIIDSLEYNKVYFWRVRAYRPKDTGHWSNVFKFTSFMQQPQLLTPACDSLNFDVDLTFTWNTVSGAQKIGLQLSKDPDFSTKILNLSDLTNTNYHYSKLSHNTKYYWRLRALRVNDSTDWTDACEFTTLLATPILEYPVKDTSIYPYNMTFAWSEIEDAEFYSLIIAEDSNFVNVIKNFDNIVTNYKVIFDLQINKQIYWKVIAKSGLMRSSWSNTGRFYTTGGVELSPPSLSQPSNNSFDNEINGKFSWNPVPDALKYSIQVSEDIDFTNIHIDSTDIKLTSINYYDFEFDKVYYWRVKAFVIYDSSEWSNTWSMKTIQKPSLELVKLESPNDDDLQVSLSGDLVWKAVQNVISYSVQLSDNFNFTNSIIDENGLTVTSYPYSGLDYHKDYYWRVKYYTSDDSSKWSSVWVFKTSSREILNTPELTSPANNDKSIGIDGELFWDHVDGAKSYRVVISKIADFSKKDRNEFGIIENRMPYFGLEYNTVYYWKVAAFADSSTSKWSQTRSFLSQLASPLAIYPDDGTTDLSPKGEIRWTEIQGAEQYYFQLSLDSNFSNLIEDRNNLNQTHFKYDLDTNKLYYWRIKATNPNNESKWSNIYRFKTGNTIGIEDHYQSNEILIYPNPATDKINIQFYLNKNSEISLTVFTLDGIKLSNYNYKNLNIGKQILTTDLRNLHNGIYFLQLKYQDEIKLIPIIIEK